MPPISQAQGDGQAENTVGMGCPHELEQVDQVVGVLAQYVEGRDALLDELLVLGSLLSGVALHDL
jgi:hypothetical protein